jgi:hypothetical protein
MNRTKLAFLLGALLAAGVANAQINEDTGPNLGPHLYRPGSLLIYPILDVSSTTATLVTVTNVNTDESLVPGFGVKRGAVLARFFYVIYTASGCSIFDIEEELSPGDTFTTLVSNHVGISGNLQGWLYVVAADVNTRRVIDFDDELETTPRFSGLIGEEMIVSGSPQMYLYALPAISLRSLAEAEPRARNIQGYEFADVNGDGEADFDNTEYDRFPEVLSAPLFLEQSSDIFRDEIVLLTPLFRFGETINLRSNFYNNNEDFRSVFFFFNCWTRLRIRDLLPFTRNLNGVPTEVNSGWFWIRPDSVSRLGQLYPEPPVHGAFIHELAIGNTGFWAANILHQEGEVEPIPGAIGLRGNGLPVN